MCAHTPSNCHSDFRFTTHVSPIVPRKRLIFDTESDSKALSPNWWMEKAARNTNPPSDSRGWRSPANAIVMVQFAKDWNLIMYNRRRCTLVDTCCSTSFSLIEDEQVPLVAAIADTISSRYWPNSTHCWSNKYENQYFVERLLCVHGTWADFGDEEAVRGGASPWKRGYM